jgi:Ca2+-binding RTX toxin-like protein
MAPTYTATTSPTYSASTGPTYSGSTGPTYSATTPEYVYGWGTAGNDLRVLPAVYNAYSAGGGNDSVFGNIYDDVLGGGEGNDELYGAAGNDTLWGGNGSDFLDGGTGNDVMYGEAGSDVFAKSAGNDVMYGGADSDVFYMGMGKDIAYGEAGNDLFIADTSGIRGFGVFDLGKAVGGDGSFDLIDIWGTTDISTVKVLLSGVVGGPVTTTLQWTSGVQTYKMEVSGIEKIEINNTVYDLGQFII